MANEALLRNRLDAKPFDWITDNTLAMEKGTVCKISGDRMAFPSSADGDKFAGILVRERIASDGRTRVSLMRGPSIWDMVSISGDPIAVGAAVKISGVNVIAPADDDTVENSMETIGFALEAASLGERIQVLVRG